MVNYYQMFVENMRFIRCPLDSLLKKDATWKWTRQHQHAFQQLTTILQSEHLLTHYDPKLTIIVAADASDYRIGAVMQHKMSNGSIKAVTHVSRTLTPAEQKYSQIEKEGLALIFAVTKFHTYVYGRHFTLLTDHQPLIPIFGSKKHSAKRLHCWSVILLVYDFKILINNRLWPS